MTELERTKGRLPFFIDRQGYRHIRVPDHPRACRGFVREHIVLAENMLGRSIMRGEVVHHTDLAKGTINPFGLVVCASHEEHMALHRKTRALAATGDEEKRICYICQTYDDAANMGGNAKKGYRHNTCHNAQNKRPNRTGRRIKVGELKPACHFCGKRVEKPWSEINRAIKLGRKIFCNHNCDGASRKKGDIQ